MEAKEIVEGLIDQSVDRYKTYAFATGVLSITVLGLLGNLEPHHRERVLRELKEIKDRL